MITGRITATLTERIKIISLEAWTWSWTSFHQEMVKNLVLQFCLHFWFRTSSFQKGMIASSTVQIARKMYVIQSLDPTRGGPCSCLIDSRICFCRFSSRASCFWILQIADELKVWNLGIIIIITWKVAEEKDLWCVLLLLLLYQVNCSENTFPWCHTIFPKRASACLSVLFSTLCLLTTWGATSILRPCFSLALWVTKGTNLYRPNV